MKTNLRILFTTLCFLISTLAFAHDGGGGGFHGGGAHGGGVPNNGGYHPNNGYHNGYNNGYHNNNGWYGGGGAIVNVNTGDDDWYDNGLYDDNATNVVIGVPDGGYYDPSCQAVQTCNPDGECITQQNCN